MSRGRYFTLKNDKIGAALRLVSGAEATLDLRPLATDPSLPTNPPRYPMTIEVRSVSNDHYLRQGASTVALNATATQNYPLSAGNSFELTAESEAEAYLAVETTDLGGGELLAIRIDAVN